MADSTQYDLLELQRKVLANEQATEQEVFDLLTALSDRYKGRLRALRNTKNVDVDMLFASLDAKKKQETP